MNKAIVLLVFLFCGIIAISQSVKNYNLYGYKQERTGGASMNNEDGTVANNVTIDYWLFISSKNSQKPSIKTVYINGYVMPFKLTLIERIPNFLDTQNAQKRTKLNPSSRTWQIVVDALELEKINGKSTRIQQKNEVIVVFKNNQKLFLRQVNSIVSKTYE